MSTLRVQKKISDRHSLGHVARRAEKHAERARFRQDAQKSFGQISHALRTLDYAIVGVFEQFATFKVVQFALDIVVFAAILFVSGYFQPWVVLTAAGFAFLPLVYYVYQQRKRAANARERALLTALEQQKRNGVAPPPQQPIAPQ